MKTCINYEYELDHLHHDLKAMDPLAEEAIQKAFLALKDKDYRLAEEIIGRERLVTDMERSIESRCLPLILRQ